MTIDFARVGEIERLLDLLRHTGVRFEQDLHWLLWAAAQPPDRWPSTTLNADQLEALGQAADQRDLAETALAARQLGMPAGEQIIDHLLSGAERESTDNFGHDMRNLALKDLLLDLCDAGALSDAARVLSRIRKSGGDGENHVDWSLAIGAFGKACCRHGDVDRGRALITKLDVFDTDERSAVDQIRIATAIAYLNTGALELAEREVSAVPTLRSRHHAQGILANRHCFSGRL